MAKGIIYVMKTVVPGLVKIGKTGSGNFENRMYELEHNGYRNVTGLKRIFAIEVDEYDDKEKLLHTIFEKSQLSDTELFAIDVNIVIQLLSSFDGTTVYPLAETKEEVFEEATDNIKGKLIPNGSYVLKRKKRADKKAVDAIAFIENGSWTIKKGSTLGVSEGIGMSVKAKKVRGDMPVDESGKLLEDYELGECSPSFAAAVVVNGSADGWLEWKNSNGKYVDIYREKETEE